MEEAAPEVFNVFITKMAPVIIIKTSKELSAPYKELASSAKISICQNKLPNTSANTQEIKRQRFAGQLNAIIRINVANTGKKANNANTDIFLLSHCLKKSLMPFQFVKKQKYYEKFIKKELIRQ